jgi:predicted amidohydrolase
MPSGSRANKKSATARKKKSGVVNLAICQFPVSGDILANSRWIKKQMAEARKDRADIVHFSECALSGYPGVDLPSLEGFDWDLCRAETESIMALAARYKQWVVLGSSHPLSRRHKPHNCLYVIDPRGRLVDRYDKRFCTTGDLKHYAPGDHLVTFNVNGVKCGLLICYDMRFPELYREYLKQGVKLMLHSFHNAHGSARGIWADIMPPSLRCRAATNGMWVSANNSSARVQQWTSFLTCPDGLVAGRLRPSCAGVSVIKVDTSKEFYDASAPFRRKALKGQLNSGKVLRDPRSQDRKSL